MSDSIDRLVRLKRAWAVTTHARRLAEEPRMESTDLCPSEASRLINRLHHILWCQDQHKRVEGARQAAEAADNDRAVRLMLDWGTTTFGSPLAPEKRR